MSSLQETIQRIRNGEQEAYRAIIHEFAPIIRVYLSGHIRDFRDVEELSQEIFGAVYWNLDSYNSDLSFAAWIKAIARNKLMSHFRRHYSQKNMVNELRAEIIEQLPASDWAPNEATTSVLQQLTRCVGKQSEDAAELVQARYFDREPVQAIAARLGTTENSISSRLYRIRKKLKHCIEGGLSA